MPSHAAPLHLCRFQCSLAAPSLAYMHDHVVQGTSILPGAGMLEMCTARWAAWAAGGADLCSMWLPAHLMC